MAELTKEQLIQAEDAYLAEWGRGGMYDEALRAAAPFLQLPWDEATEAEAERLYSLYSVQSCGHDKAMLHALNDFLVTRNAKLLPKPVDKRREPISILLTHEEGYTEDHAAKLADKILAELDGAK